jgi:hypothetical protein
MRVDVSTVVELAGIIAVVGGGFVLGIGEGIVAIGVVLLYEART